MDSRWASGSSHADSRETSPTNSPVLQCGEYPYAPQCVEEILDISRIRCGFWENYKYLHDGHAVLNRDINVSCIKELRTEVGNSLARVQLSVFTGSRARTLPTLSVMARTEERAFWEDLGAHTPLGVLMDRLPAGFYGKKLLDALWQFNVNVIRATWFVKIAYRSRVTESKPGFGVRAKKCGTELSRKCREEWTIHLKSHMSEILSEISKSAGRDVPKILLEKWGFFTELFLHHFQESLLIRPHALSFLIDSLSDCAAPPHAVLSVTKCAPRILPLLARLLPVLCEARVQLRRLCLALNEIAAVKVHADFADLLKTNIRDVVEYMSQKVPDTRSWVADMRPLCEFVSLSHSHWTDGNNSESDVRSQCDLITLLDKFASKGDASEIVQFLCVEDRGVAKSVINRSSLSTLLEWAILADRSYIHHRAVSVKAIIESFDKVAKPFESHPASLQEVLPSEGHTSTQSSHSLCRVLIDCLDDLNPSTYQEYLQVYRVYSALSDACYFDYDMYIHWLDQNDILLEKSRDIFRAARHRNYLMNFTIPEYATEALCLSRRRQRQQLLNRSSDFTQEELDELVHRDVRLRTLCLNAVSCHLDALTRNELSQINDEHGSLIDVGEMRWARSDLDMFGGIDRWIDFDDPKCTDVHSLLGALPFGVCRYLIERLADLLKRFVAVIQCTTDDSAERPSLTSLHESFRTTADSCLYLFEALDFSECLFDSIMALLPADSALLGLLSAYLGRNMDLFVSIGKIVELKAACVSLLRSLPSVKHAEVWLDNAPLPTELLRALKSNVLHTWARAEGADSQRKKKRVNSADGSARNAVQLGLSGFTDKQNSLPMSDLITILDENVCDPTTLSDTCQAIVIHILRLCSEIESDVELGTYFSRFVFVVRQVANISARFGYRQASLADYFMNMVKGEVLSELVQETTSSSRKYIQHQIPSGDFRLFIQKRFLCFLLILTRDGFLPLHRICSKLICPTLQATHSAILYPSRALGKKQSAGQENLPELIGKSRLCICFLCMLLGLRDDNIFSICQNQNLVLLERILESNSSMLAVIFPILEVLLKLSVLKPTDDRQRLLLKDISQCLWAFPRSPGIRGMFLCDCAAMYSGYMAKSAQALGVVVANVMGFEPEVALFAKSSPKQFVREISVSLTPWCAQRACVFVQIQLNALLADEANRVQLVNSLAEVLLQNAAGRTPADSEDYIAPDVAVCLVQYIGSSIGPQVLNEISKLLSEEFSQLQSQFETTKPSENVQKFDSKNQSDAFDRLCEAFLGGEQNGELTRKSPLYEEDSEIDIHSAASPSHSTSPPSADSSTAHLARVVAVLSGARGIARQRREFVRSVCAQLSGILECVRRRSEMAETHSAVILSDVHRRVECLRHFTDPLLQSRVNDETLFSLIKSLIGLVASKVLDSENNYDKLRHNDLPFPPCTRSICALLHSLFDGLVWPGSGRKGRGTGGSGAGMSQDRALLARKDERMIAQLQVHLQDTKLSVPLRHWLYRTIPSLSGNIHDPISIKIRVESRNEKISSKSTITSRFVVTPLIDLLESTPGASAAIQSALPPAALTASHHALMRAHAHTLRRAHARARSGVDWARFEGGGRSVGNVPKRRRIDGSTRISGVSTPETGTLGDTSRSTYHRR
eukprot:921536_1